MAETDSATQGYKKGYFGSVTQDPIHRSAKEFRAFVLLL